MKIIHQDSLSKNVGLVVNMVANDDEGRMVANALDRVSARFLSKPMDLFGVVPASPLIPKSLQLRRPFLLEFPDEIASDRIRSVAKTILQRQAAAARGVSLDGAKMLEGLLNH